MHEGGMRGSKRIGRVADPYVVSFRARRRDKQGRGLGSYGEKLREVMRFQGGPFVLESHGYS